MKFLILATLLALPLQAENEERDTKQDLQDKYNTYLNLQTDSMRNDCDGLLYRSLISVAGNSQVNVHEHYKKPYWVRSPDNSCTSTSIISRDMMIGLWWWLWRTKDVNTAVSIRKYANLHFGNMGEGNNKDFMSPALYDTLNLIIKKLGGPNNSVTVTAPFLPPIPLPFPPINTPMIWDKSLEGYQAHLAILHILLRAELEGLKQSGWDTISAYYNREPENALFAYAYGKYVSGNMQPAINSLLNETWFPRHRLPTSHDRCDQWLWQRRISTEKDWIPCPEQARTHSGGDFLFVAKLVLGHIFADSL